MDFGNFRKGKFAREHDARGALPLPEFCRMAVGGVRLRGEVQRKVRRDLPREGERARIRDQRGVRTDLGKVAKIIGQRGEIGRACA